MGLKRFAYFLVALLFLTFFNLQPLATYAETALNIPEGGVRISEIYANPPGSPESEFEFIELHNTLNTSVDLAGFKLIRDDDLTSPLSNGEMTLGQITLQAGEYRTFKPSFSLPNGGSTIMLAYPFPYDYVDLQTYGNTSGSEGKSWQQVDSNNNWGFALPTANTAPIIEPPSDPIDEEPDPGEDDEEPEPPEEDELCDIEHVHVSEILSNPAGNDSTGNEFVELFNNNTHEISLEDCELSTDKSASFLFTEQHTIPAKSYRTFIFHNGLLNNHGVVTFATAGYEEVIEYPPLKDDEAYAFIQGVWQTTKKMTPNEANALPTIEEEVGGDLGSLSPCPPGKFRNPVTNRCKNITSSVSSLTPCKTGQYRNQQTNRCRNTTTASASLVPCKPGYERNAATNRCRKIGSTQNTLKPCDKGYERNPETNRCRKVSTIGANVDSTSQTPSSMQGQNFALIIVAASFLLFFLLYEYRLTLRDKFAAMRFPRFPKQG